MHPMATLQLDYAGTCIVSESALLATDSHMVQLKLNLSATEEQYLMTCFDIDGDQQINLNEFLGFFAKGLCSEEVQAIASRLRAAILKKVARCFLLQSDCGGGCGSRFVDSCFSFCVICSTHRRMTAAGKPKRS